MSDSETSLDNYTKFINNKRIKFCGDGLSDWREIDESMFDHQLHGTDFALRCGRSALFYDTGLGKSRMAHVWAQRIIEHTNKPVLLLAPLAVGHQHVREAATIGIDARVIRNPGAIDKKIIYVINYDRLDKIEDVSIFGGVVLDESSIMKNFTGVTTRNLIQKFSAIPFRLACTATPAPNDFTEIGTHAEFLSVMRRDEMLPIWFMHDSADTGTWRLKKHAVSDFWRWVASWARCVSKPSDLGFCDDGFDLPELNIINHTVPSDISINAGEEKTGQLRLFRIPETSATSIHKEKKLSQDKRVKIIVEAVNNEPNEQWLIWCETNEESEKLTKSLPLSTEIRGAHTPDDKEKNLLAFLNGDCKQLVTKPSIAGFGINAQCCARMAFIGLSFSYEQYYQAIRRCWRFGQTRGVDVHIAGSESEHKIHEIIKRKASDHDAMKLMMRDAMREVINNQTSNTVYSPQVSRTMPIWI